MSEQLTVSECVQRVLEDEEHAMGGRISGGRGLGGEKQSGCPDGDKPSVTRA